MAKIQINLHPSYSDAHYIHVCHFFVKPKGSSERDRRSPRLLRRRICDLVRSKAADASHLVTDLYLPVEQRTCRVRRGGHRSLALDGGYLLRRGSEQNDSKLTTIIGIEQWICFLLGVVCILFGMRGICMECSQEALPRYVAWLGTAYVPALRAIAMLCFGLGIALVHQAWRRP